MRLDESTDQKIQINFNVTLHHLPCRFSSVDIADIMGTHLQNVSTNLIKTRISAAGVPIGKAAPQAKSVSHAVAYSENAPTVSSGCMRPRCCTVAVTLSPAALAAKSSPPYLSLHRLWTTLVAPPTARSHLPTPLSTASSNFVIHTPCSIRDREN